MHSGPVTGTFFFKVGKNPPGYRKDMVLLENNYKDIKNSNGEVLYRMKECVDDFVYTCIMTMAIKKSDSLKNVW